MPSPILARADALMQRRRQNAEIDDVPVLTDAIDLDLPESDDDIPVLLDCEPIDPLYPLPGLSLTAADTPIADPPPLASEAPTLPEPAYAEPALPESLPTIPTMAVAEDIAREIAHRVEQRLIAELPRIIAATIHDFLAEQGTNTIPDTRHPD